MLRQERNQNIDIQKANCNEKSTKVTWKTDVHMTQTYSKLTAGSERKDDYRDGKLILRRDLQNTAQCSAT